MATILLVEDEVLLREGIQEVLEVNGYTVIAAADGAEALAWLERVPVMLVISDLVMPHMNGIEFIQRVRGQYPNLPILVASGCSYSVMGQLGISSTKVPGATASITKPFKATELIGWVKQLVPAVCV
jgi:CheY-like chemotaxis protein